MSKAFLHCFRMLDERQDHRAAKRLAPVPASRHVPSIQFPCDDFTHKIVNLVLSHDNVNDNLLKVHLYKFVSNNYCHTYFLLLLSYNRYKFILSCEKDLNI